MNSFNNSDPKSQAKKPKSKAVKLGQVFTPSEIAKQMAHLLLDNHPKNFVSILDPCVGPGTFPKALHECNLLFDEDQLVCYDIDGDMIEQCKNVIEQNLKDKIVFHFEDFLLSENPAKYDCIIVNPPYVRQEWIDQKLEYQSFFRSQFNCNIPGTSNLYVYFIVKCVEQLKPDGTIVCIVYDSWQANKYGKWLKSYLEYNCQQISLVNVKQQPFDGRLIDATIICAKKNNGKAERPICANYTEDYFKAMDNSSPFLRVDGFSQMDTVFATKRGLRLKQADFFLCDEKGLDIGATRFVKKVAKIKGYGVEKEHPEAALLVEPDSICAEGLLRELNYRIENAVIDPGNNVAILTWYNERRQSWYYHRKPPTDSIIFNYYLRNKPKHIYNPEIAFSDNFYGLTSYQNIPTLAWLAVLNATCTCIEIFAHARNQGNGLAKIQLCDYRLVMIPDVAQCSTNTIKTLTSFGERLLTMNRSQQQIINQIDDFVYATWGNEMLLGKNLLELNEEFEIRARRPRILEENSLCHG